MITINNEAASSSVHEQFFDCNKMKSLLDDKEPLNFSERFKNWVAAYTKNAQEKIWRDVEYFQSH